MSIPQKITQKYHGISYQLDFLLHVETSNHEVITQTPDDKSRYNNGSFYGDISKLKLVKATLVGKGHILSLSLVDGHAELDGHPLFPPKPPQVAKLLDLIYYRDVQQGVLTNYADKSSIQMPLVKYFIGWKTNHLGKNYQWLISID